MDVQRFLTVFIQTYQGHGGKVENKTPAIYEHSPGEDLANAVAATRTAAGNQGRPKYSSVCSYNILTL